MYQKRAYRNKNVKKEISQKNKITKRDTIIALISFLGIFLAAAFFAYRMMFINPSEVHQADKNLAYQIVPNNEVCMLNNTYRTEAIPFVLIGKHAYFGCCNSCTDRLLKNPEERYAIDPITKVEVDKSMAIILRKVDDDSSIYYFNTTHNAKTFMIREKKNQKTEQI
ncbi:hypothetical protein SAMN04487764_0217 [Gillisia sp. Hel1_33_143]|uniref:hypothetical protein n=1 Tax=Gillisia sp. Hel1_33_143 TaxID=1336796 RepID=UPI00087B256C|nr:hypothetical protein [Gillisia sp. Hel1_33_143]SDR68072.1 hypothetical protein SAMN04487764_0217 [Gillisia sp. Hel1_33_143]